MKPRLLLDLDNTIVDLDRSVIAESKKQGGYRHDTCTWHFDGCCHDEGFMEAAFTTPGIFAEALPIHLAVYGVRRLLDNDSLDVFFVSTPWASNPQSVAEKTVWVQNWFGREGVKRLILTRDKTVITGDILVDDKPGITGASRPSWVHWLYPQQWNDGAARGVPTWINGLADHLTEALMS